MPVAVGVVDRVLVGRDVGELVGVEDVGLLVDEVGVVGVGVCVGSVDVGDGVSGAGSRAMTSLIRVP